MTQGRELALLAWDDRISGLQGGSELGCALAGAELLDLLESGRLGIRGADLVVLGRTLEHPETGDPRFDRAIAVIKLIPEPKAVQAWIKRHAPELRDSYLALLEDEGTVGPRHVRRLGLLPTTRTGLTDPSERDALVARLSLLAPEDEPLAALAHRAGLTPFLFPGPEHDDLRETLAETTRGWSEALPPTADPEVLADPATATRTVLRQVRDAVVQLHTAGPRRHGGYEALNRASQADHDRDLGHAHDLYLGGGL
ncbi:GOLPH3/VPS74 family protein [Streptacidiphilus carbonis]|uniref:GOLPH3/VPS74 family protein n=1 Tax=Streptacidiphilus carbonis TaxID=105422 RepID=UPI0005A632C4|nr:GPP34 family phosphoprotein [Streptacidiphilus carbonis]